MTRRLSAIWLALLTSLALAAPAAATDFKYPDFASTSGLTLNGNAVQKGNVLQLTPAENDKAGSAFVTAPLNPQESFATQFALSMHDSSTFPLPADGMAFVIQSKGPSGGEGLGGSLGYGEIKPSVAVEFDIFENFFGGDPTGEHVGIMSEGDTTKHLACANEGTPTPPCTAKLEVPLYGAPVYGWVEYDAATQRLKVFVSASATKPAAPLLDHQISLAPLGASSYAGFTAATGASNAVHDLLSWSFDQADPAAPPIAKKGAKKAKKCPVAKKGKKGKGKGKKASASKAQKKGKKGKGKKCGHKNKGKKGKGKGKRG